MRRYWPFIPVLLIAGWAVWSWSSGGLIALIVQSASDGTETIERLRSLIIGTGAWAPVVYVLAVVVEVMVAPIPGALLYAPGGAIFGGFLGGTLSLAGNVIGAGLATWLGATLGARVTGNSDSSKLQQIAARIRERGLLVVVLLRINPLTSSDLVSYAAGLAGVAVWRVALGTAIGMAPLCYAQAYASEWIFRVLPGSGLVLLGLAAAYVAVIGWLLFRGTLSRT